METVYRILAVLGGTTVVLGALALFFDNLIRDCLKQHWKKKSDLELEEAKEHGKVATIQPQHFVGDQYLYVKLWRALASLRAVVDGLWQSANPSTILLLAKHLRAVKKHAGMEPVFRGPASRTASEHDQYFGTLSCRQGGSTLLALHSSVFSC